MRTSSPKIMNGAFRTAAAFQNLTISNQRSAEELSTVTIGLAEDYNSRNKAGSSYKNANGLRSSHTIAHKKLRSSLAANDMRKS